MAVTSNYFSLKTNGNGEIIDITGNVSQSVMESGITSGIVTVFAPGSTAGVTTIEFEPGLVEDMDDMFDRLIPRDREYHHNLRWHDGNGHSHVRASLLGPSLTVPFEGGKLKLGIWQQIVLVDFDNKARDREMICQVIGE
ncbi:MAG: secondary thiamine-phosphate synthase enzyme YjbQ [Actinobacteria bacterium]|nr:secondary thiamine-phosphate synthase enzyme YjbQ [Actinomycetota bacterium]MCG2820077.1 secondary thiamine-phosphate synthase enzyme YjbQ [Actinomycetes bacterium]MBU4359164.1 secondary thiamine-phosphate synthase enzyme YjbQ [Actinomycetota bacterium]MBU4392321.1 secondary thiamine-phosphate synthase enzyme YjbQ [Actinomycetota bacterium]MBU4403619.1 secondary thiamine-phosphate synthase enzyme YjbQ [Actinomycetota bacterium]